MTHEDVLGLPVQEAQEILQQRGIDVSRVIWTCAPKSPQQEGHARVVAVRENGSILVAARFLDGTIQA